jgi:fucose permease
VRSLFESRVFWIAGLAFLFYVPLESSVAGWATTLVVKQGPGGERAASLALSGFWLGFMGSRLLVSLLGLHGHELPVLVALSAGCVAFSLALSVFRDRLAVAVSVVAAGLICGPVFPTLIGIYLKDVPGPLLGRAVGFFFAFASTGWTLVPALIGTVARRTDDIQKGFRVAVVSAVLFAGFLSLLRGVK